MGHSKQYELVIQTLEKLGGQATLASLYTEVPGTAEWGTKTPFATIRRIVQTRPEIFKVRPGLYALRSWKGKLGLAEQGKEAEGQVGISEATHSYFQGLLIIVGNLRGFSTFAPNQDRNKKCVNKRLGELRTLPEIPSFSYDRFVRRSSTIDVIWFNGRLMPSSLFEVEHNTDIQNSLLKFYELQDFSARMVIVADEIRQREFDSRLQQGAFSEIRKKVAFLSYESLVKQYEAETVKSKQAFLL